MRNTEFCTKEIRAMDITQGFNDETCYDAGANWPFEFENWEGEKAMKYARFDELDGYALYQHYAEKASLFDDDVNVSVIDHSVSIYGDETRDGMVDACCTIEAIEDVEGGNTAREEFLQLQKALRKQIQEVKKQALKTRTKIVKTDEKKQKSDEKKQKKEDKKGKHGKHGKHDSHDESSDDDEGSRLLSAFEEDFDDFF